jgi:hypothetical protein
LRPTHHSSLITHHSRDLARAAAIVLVVFAIYFVGYSRTLPPTADEMVNFGLAQSIAKWQSVAIDQVSTVGPNPEEFGADDHRYGKYGPLQAVLSVPLFLIAQQLPIGAVDAVLLLNHLVSALTAGLVFLLIRRLGYPSWVALALVGVVAFGTPLWVQSKRYFGEPTITLTVVLTVYAAYVAATTGRRRWLLATGVAFSLAMAAKYVDALLLLPVPLYLGWALAAKRGVSAPLASGKPGYDPHPNPLPEGEGTGLPPFTGLSVSPHPKISLSPWERVRVRVVPQLLRAWFYFGLGALPIVALLGWYDWARFGSPLLTGYARWEGFSTPVWVGFTGFLFSPGKSIFVYTPIFLFLPFWAPRFVRCFPAFGALLGALVVLHLVLFGAWWVWWGAWAWGPRFIVPILPLVALFLAEGLRQVGTSPPAPLHRVERAVRRSGRGEVPQTQADTLALRALAIGLGALGVVIQILGLSVDHTVYLVQLLPLNSKPDTLTLYDLHYSPILHQIPLLTRQWLDFAWIQRTGPTEVDLLPLLAALGGVTGALLAFALVWRSTGWARWLPALALGGALVAGGALQALRIYHRQIDPAMAQLVTAIDRAPAGTRIVQLIPSAVVPYADSQKRDLPELGWIEEPKPAPLIVRRLAKLTSTASSIWLLTETTPKSPSNGVEAMLDRSLVQVGDDTLGSFRLLRYATKPEDVQLAPRSARFADGIALTGFAAPDRPVQPGQTLNVVLAWQADPSVTSRPDYTVFVHLVDASGALIAQHDDPPASGYAPTSSWRPGQLVYDDHTIVVPPNAPAGLRLVQVGLYLPSTGQRAPLVGPDGQSAGDTVTLDLE